MEIFNHYNKNYEKYKFLKGSSIIIEGVVGAGKTTFCGYFTDILTSFGLDVVFYPEYINMELLKKFLDSKTQESSFWFQMCVLGDRKRIYESALRDLEKGKVVVIDRGLYGDYAMAKYYNEVGSITDKDFKIYMNSLAECKKLNPPSYTVFLDVTPMTAICRKEKRNRIEEINSFDMNFYNKHTEVYKSVMKEIPDGTIDIDWNNKYDNEVIFKTLEKIREKYISM